MRKDGPKAGAISTNRRHPIKPGFVATREPAPRALCRFSAPLLLRPQAQQHRASGLALVTAAIVLWNTVYLGRALERLRRQGEAAPMALLAHLAPLGWWHINLTGDYLWPTNPKLEPDGFRALRTRTAMPVAA
jgi:hypothetical protein